MVSFGFPVGHPKLGCFKPPRTSKKCLRPFAGFMETHLFPRGRRRLWVTAKTSPENKVPLFPMEIHSTLGPWKGAGCSGDVFQTSLVAPGDLGLQTSGPLGASQARGSELLPFWCSLVAPFLAKVQKENLLLLCPLGR